MKIACLGGGPAGLFFAILMKQADPGHQITVYERNRPDDTFGWGVVFSDQTMAGFRRHAPEVVDQIERAFRHWDDIDTYFRGDKITSRGHGFAGIARKKLLQILQDRAAALGVELIYEADITDPDAYAATHDLVIGADGVHSVTRKRHEAHFNPRIAVGDCRFIWLGTRRKLDAFTFAFREHAGGWWNLHAYRFDDEWSTFIVETPEAVWRRAGGDDLGPERSIALCEELFAELLDGERLVSNARHLRGAAVWLKFNRVLCERWYKDNIVLIGDAAHTAHFSIGSGTKLAMEDAIALAAVLHSTDGDVATRLGRYQAEREVEALKLQSAARNRMTWFEHVERYVTLPPQQFVFSLLTGSQRVGHANQRLRDPAYVDGVERALAVASGLPDRPVPPMFTPFAVRDLRLANRVAVSPMCMYSATEGCPDDFHLVHYGSRATGGAGLIFTEMTAVAADARITPGCAGLYRDDHEAAWTRIVDYVHRAGPAKLALQLGHAGRKGATKLAWEGADQPLPTGGWPLYAPSPLPYLPGVSAVPRAMTRADLDAVIADHVAAAERAARCGFDLLELHCAHGYLLSSFLSPLTNQRDDDYGGDLERRCRFPLEVFAAVRAVWPAERPMSVRLSAHDWAPGGTTGDDAVEIARRFQAAGVDLVHVSSGQVVKHEQPVYGRMFQVPLSDQIRNTLGVPTIAVGNIFEADHVNTIIAAGRADLCALARPHLADPYWTLHAAAEQGYADVVWPVQYGAGRAQLERNLARATPLAQNA
ncbi:MAG: bifunctional salicylyl-CoA 5-hydroxylase/oxidoreductase [Kofleriaceae bacterium]|nr:bifunctional salicylyl-CoA 5-hydroxylase/oxidoreductase [Kofleriaceae bacterium]MBP9172338.1 bifunctional salicylyl-CoA 5-hydroxylase/oxidoreductase [Kofleriaceae bacterium]MBP9857443.1 bifunctional salicylyl-CoA 5-hydroxylase/oxidoreductase [Kofleriaceae bacterium]